MEGTANGQNGVAPQTETPSAQVNQNTDGSESIEPTSTENELPLVRQLTQGLEECDWEQLQEKYADAMDEHGRVEENLRAEMAKLFEVFMAWCQTTVWQDENRAGKRFKTQMQHVQNSESNVENKRKHYTEVVQAFQSALALLNAQLRG